MTFKGSCVTQANHILRTCPDLAQNWLHVSSQWPGFQLSIKQLHPAICESGTELDLERQR